MQNFPNLASAVNSQPKIPASTDQSPAVAPWVEGAFCPTDRLYLQVKWRLGKSAQRIYDALLVFANQETGLAFPSRETLADVAHCSLDTVDRGLAKLLKKQLVERAGITAGGVVVYRLLPPSRWADDLFGTAGKCAAPEPQNCGQIMPGEAAEMRPETRRSFDKKEFNNRAKARAIAAVDFQSNPVEAAAAAPLADPELLTALTRRGLDPVVAERLAAAKPDECRRQLAWLDARHITRNRAGYLRRAIESAWPPPSDAGEKRRRERRNDEQGSAQNGGAYELYRREPQETPPPAPESAAALPEPAVADEDDWAPPTPPAQSVAAAAVFHALPEAEKDALRAVARQGVEPIFWDRLEAPESPFSLTLWELVQERYPEKFL